MKHYKRIFAAEGGYFDCLLHKNNLMLWDIDGAVSYYKWSDMLRGQFNYIINSNRLNEYLLKKHSTPGKSLACDVTFMGGRLFTATQDGLYRGEVRHDKIWDGRLFSISAHSEKPMLALGCGDEGLLEYTESSIGTLGMRLAEKTTPNLFVVSDKAVRSAFYSGWDIVGSSNEINTLSLFDQQKSERRFVRTTYLDKDFANPYGGMKYRNGIAYLQHDSTVDYIQPNKNTIQSFIKSFDVNKESYGRVLDITDKFGKYFFEFDNGLIVVEGDVVVLSIEEPIVRWRCYRNILTHEEWLIVLLDDRFEIYILSSIAVEERKILKPASFDKVVKFLSGSGKLITSPKEACDFLNKLFSYTKGQINIDMIDTDNEDHLTEAEYDKKTGTMLLKRKLPESANNTILSEQFRKVFGYDARIVAFKFNELKVVEYKGFPFVLLKGSPVFESMAVHCISNYFDSYIKLQEDNISSVFKAEKEGILYQVKFFKSAVTNSCISAKGLKWSPRDGAKLIMLDNLDRIKESIWEISIKSSRVKRIKSKDASISVGDVHLKLMKLLLLLVRLDTCSMKIQGLINNVPILDISNLAGYVENITKIRGVDYISFEDLIQVIDQLQCVNSISKYRKLTEKGTYLLDQYRLYLQTFVHSV